MTPPGSPDLPPDLPPDVARDTGTAIWAAAPLAFVTIIGVMAAQLLIGTIGGAESAWRIDRPFGQDYWYYAGLARAVLAGFWPTNPAFAGEYLSQYNFHLLPLSLLQLLISPYLAMRLLNVVYCIGLVLLLRRYLPRCYGGAAFCMLLTGPIYYQFNPVSIDLLTRGFHHGPFFLLLLPALFEQRNRLVRGLTIFALPWVHGLMALGFAPAVLFASRRDWKWHWPALLGGFITAGAGVMIVSGGEGGGWLVKSLGFRPVEPVLHLLPLAAVLFYSRRPVVWVMVATGLAAATVVGWNRYYFLFVLNVALAIAAAEALASDRKGVAGVATICIAIAFTAGVIGGYCQLHEHRPYNAQPTADAVHWVTRNTSADAVILQAPATIDLLENDAPYRTAGHGYWLLAHRDLHIGFAEWATDLGLPGVDRARQVHQYLSNQGPLPDRVDYVFYGPMEQANYPIYAPRGVAEVYRDAHVVIFKHSNRPDPVPDPLSPNLLESPDPPEGIPP